MQSEPSSKESRRDIIPKLYMIPRLDQLQRFHTQHIPRNNKKDRNRKVTPREERPHTRQLCKVEILIISEAILKKAIRFDGIATPELMMAPIHHKRRKASQSVQIRRLPNLLPRP